MARPDRSEGRTLRMVGRHEPTCRGRSRLLTASSRCHRTTSPRSRHPRAGLGSTPPSVPAAMPSSGFSTASTPTSGIRPTIRCSSRTSTRRHSPERPANRTALLKRLGLPGDDVPLATIVTRLTHQKGVDLITPLVPLLADIPMRLGILGSGDAVLAAELHRLVDAHPEHLAFVEGYDEALIAADVRRRRPVPHAEPFRAVRADPDAGHALRGDPGRHGRRRPRRHGS